MAPICNPADINITMEVNPCIMNIPEAKAIISRFPIGEKSDEEVLMANI